MASGTREIKRKIKSVNSTMQITKAFELVSSAKLRRARIRFDESKAYFQTLKNAINEVLVGETNRGGVFLKNTESKKPLVIVIASDRGLCGGFNINNIKTALSISNEAVYIPVGKKAQDYLANRKYNLLETGISISEKPTYEDAKYIGRLAVDYFKKADVDSVYLVHSAFLSTISLVPKSYRLLPLVTDSDDREGFRLQEKDLEKTIEPEHIELINYEPDREDVLNFLVPKYVESLIFGALIESTASEHAARRLAMESATENAGEIINNLTLTYNRARQASITQEITEIVGGAEALK